MLYEVITESSLNSSTAFSLKILSVISMAVSSVRSPLFTLLANTSATTSLPYSSAPTSPSILLQSPPQKNLLYGTQSSITSSDCTAFSRDICGIHTRSRYTFGNIFPRAADSPVHGKPPWNSTNLAFGYCKKRLFSLRGRNNFV